MNFQALQEEREIAALCDVIVRDGVRSYLEVGSKFGGSLWRVGKLLPKGSRIVSVDLPSGTKVWKESKASLERCHAALRAMGHDTYCLWGNSTDPAIIARVRGLGPFDAALLDGDHRLPGVTADWNNYGPMASIVAFHDISWKRAPEWEGTRIDVPEFWDGIKGEFRHEEFRFDESGKNNGIGVLWR